MDVCRVCLSTAADKNICDLKLSKAEVDKCSSDIFSFCLDIQIVEESKVTQKLCMKCFKKILSFYKFKAQALKNDAYLRTLNVDCRVKLECLRENVEICDNSSNGWESNDIDYLDVKDEPEIKLEDIPQEFQSDDELLSVIKLVKYEESDIIPLGSKENGILESKENAPTPVKKKKGRPKLVKSNNKEMEICDECGQSVRNLKQHARKHLPPQDRKKIKCNDCDKIFSSYGSRRKHYRTKHLGILHHCDICNKDIANLKTHMLVSHNQEKLPFGCVLCSRRFISPSILESHMLIHTKDKPYECDVCQKKFRLSVTLNHHKRQVHDKEKSHLCQFCSASFFQKHHLQIHLRTHTKEKPHKCGECGRGFASTTGLRRHEELHSGERNYTCSYCDLTFARRDYLYKHVLCHTKEKRYPCKYCGTRFGRSDHRKRHEFTAHQKHLLGSDMN